MENNKNQEGISIKEQILQLINRLGKLRLCNEYKNYKCLTDALERLFRIYVNEMVKIRKIIDNNVEYSLDDGDKAFLNCIKLLLDEEKEEVNTIIYRLLNDNKYQEYREWVIAYERLVSVLADIGCELR